MTTKNRKKIDTILEENAKDVASIMCLSMTKEERKELKGISTKGKRAARTVLYARALLLLDAGEYGQRWIVANVSEALGTTPRSLEHLKKRFVEEGLLSAIERKTRVKPPREIQFGGEFEAKLLALACSSRPSAKTKRRLRPWGLMWSGTRSWFLS